MEEEVVRRIDDRWYAKPGGEEGCYACGAEGVYLTRYRGEPKLDGPGNREPTDLCDLCANTMVGIWMQYQHQHDSETLEILKTICYVGNEILKAIRGQGREGDEDKDSL